MKSKEMEFNWEEIEKQYSPEMKNLFRKTVELLAKEGATVEQTIKLAGLLKYEIVTACRPAEQKFRDSINNSKLKMP